MTRRRPPVPPYAPPGSGAHHIDRMLDQTRNDPYQMNHKYAEPTMCPDCHAVFRHGRWSRKHNPQVSPASAQRCPACRRIADSQPAGYLTLSGPFALQHRAEILALAWHEAREEGGEHPLHRIMAAEARGEEIVITTTDVHLPRRIGNALESAYDGRLQVRPSRDEYLVRVDWSR